MNTQADAKAQNFVVDMTDALQQGKALDPPLDLSDEVQEDYADLVAVIQGLRETLIPVEPSAEYAAQLKAQLLENEAGWLSRFRKNPASLHVAALIALFAWVSLLLSRRLYGGSSPQDISEESVTTAL